MKKINNELIDPMVEPVGEKAHRVATIVFGSVPIVGAAGAEIFKSIIESPMEVRKTKWMVQVGERLNELIENNVLCIEDLQSNEAFITILTQASALAIRTHHREKLEALRSAVVNTALGTAPSDGMQDVFLSYIDSFTATHIKILGFLKDPDKWMADNDVVNTYDWKRTIGTNNLMHAVLPHAKENPELTNVIWEDLRRLRLIGQVDGVCDGEVVHYHGLYPLGVAFLNFISQQ